MQICGIKLLFFLFKKTSWNRYEVKEKHELFFTLFPKYTWPFLLIVCVTLAVWKKPMSFKYLAYTSSFLLNKFEITLRLQTTSCFLNFLFVRKIKLTYLFARLPMKTKYPFSSHWRIYVLALNLSTKPFAACHLRGYLRDNVKLTKANFIFYWLITCHYGVRT